MRSVRAEFPKSVREEAWKRCGGLCELCFQDFAGRVPNFDHYPIAASLGGPANLANCRVLCVKCHKSITVIFDMPRIAKAKRLEEKRAGIRRRKYQWPKRKLNSFQRGA